MPDEEKVERGATSRSSVPRWLLVALLLLQAHFAASYLVPLDEGAQREFWGLLPWAWPWSVGDSGPLGRIATVGFPVVGFFLAMAAGGALFLASFALLRWWLPFEWWRGLSIAGAVLTIVLMLLFFSLTKVVPITTALVIVAVTLHYWPLATRP